MDQTDKAVLILKATSHAIKAEKILKSIGIDCKLVPVPRTISSDCGVCIRIQTSDLISAVDALTKANIDIKPVRLE